MNSMNKIILYGHGGAYNHGAEAITKCTMAYLRNKHPGIPIWLSTHFREQDEEFGIPADRFLERDLSYVEKDRILPVAERGKYDNEIYRDTLSAIDSDTLLYSVGGDNYCYGNWHRWKLIHDKGLEMGAQDILWCCSIDPPLLTDGLVEHLLSFSKIVARESITYEALRAKGLENVMLRRDIAFALEEEKAPLPEGFQSGRTVAINVSPLVLRQEAVSDILMDNLVLLIDEILTHTRESILLLPHVLMPADNDREPLSHLLERYINTGRVMLADDSLSAAQRKYLIARCSAVVSARTHACIAAYSSGVPCLALGYSAKAQGIARDMGMEKWVVDIHRIRQKEELAGKFQEMWQSGQRPRC